MLLRRFTAGFSLLAAIACCGSVSAQSTGPFPLPNQPQPIPNPPRSANQPAGNPAANPNPASRLRQNNSILNKIKIERNFAAFPGSTARPGGNPRSRDAITSASPRSRATQQPSARFRPLPRVPSLPFFPGPRFPGRDEQKKPGLRFQMKTQLQVRHPSPTSVGTRFRRTLSRLPRVGKYSGITVVMNGRTATLRGSVDTAADRDLIESLAMLETGISTVKNELKVANSSPSTQP